MEPDTEQGDLFEELVGATKGHERDVLVEKHHDYGPKNIANAPGGAVMGLLVRLHDKLARVANLVEQGADPRNESLLDSATDIANYGTIMRMVLDGDWPGCEDDLGLPESHPARPSEPNRPLVDILDKPSSVGAGERLTRGWPVESSYTDDRFA